MPFDNHLLASLPRGQIDVLSPHMTTKLLQQGTVLLEAGEEFEHIYFPHNGMLSLLVVLLDGKAIEVATVGREGVVGAMAGLGLYKSTVRIVAQSAMAATSIPAGRYRKAVGDSAALRDLSIGYNEVLLQQARVTAACNAVHSIEMRFCRWILQSADRADSDTIELTQEFLSEMLGVRRTSISEVASRVQDTGCIHYSRGVIKILDRGALECLSCECYRSAKG